MTNLLSSGEQRSRSDRLCPWSITVQQYGLRCDSPARDVATGPLYVLRASDSLRFATVRCYARVP